MSTFCLTVLGDGDVKITDTGPRSVSRGPRGTGRTDPQAEKFTVTWPALWRGRGATGTRGSARRPRSSIRVLQAPHDCSFQALALRRVRAPRPPAPSGPVPGRQEYVPCSPSRGRGSQELKSSLRVDGNTQPDGLWILLFRLEARLGSPTIFPQKGRSRRTPSHRDHRGLPPCTETARRHQGASTAAEPRPLSRPRGLENQVWKSLVIVRVAPGPKSFQRQKPGTAGRLGTAGKCG